MPIVIYLGRNVKEYESKSEEKITQLIKEGKLLCELCLKALKRHSKYIRTIKETGEEITIIMVWCSVCRKWHALLPDFLLANKHYSGNEIEEVIIESSTVAVNQIDTEASESTVRRWMKEVGEKIKQAVGILKCLFGREGQAVSETAIDAGQGYSELEQVLGKAPSDVKYSGNKLGLANIWLGTNKMAVFI